MSSSIRRATRQSWILYALIVLLVMCATIAVTTAALFAKERADAKAATARADVNAQNIQSSLACISRWAAAYSQRTVLVEALSDRRINALDTLAQALAKPGATASSVEAAIKAYLSATSQYQAAVKNHPVPVAPTLSCTITPFGPSVPSPAPTVTVHATSTVHATRTVSVPGPVVQVPGPTIVRVIPGPTVTVRPCHGRDC